MIKTNDVQYVRWLDNTIQITIWSEKWFILLEYFNCLL